MTPSKYNFYIGQAELAPLYLKSNTRIDEFGNFIYGESSNYYASAKEKLPVGRLIYFSIEFIHAYNAIFFFDADKKFISSKVLADTDSAIVPPSGTEYWAARFTTDDRNFDAKKETPFIYRIKSAQPHYKSLNKKWMKENNQEFFRVSLDGKINLFGQDYEFVKNSSLEDKLIFIIDKYDNTSEKWVKYYNGEFNKIDCKFDHSRLKCELKIATIDDYSEILNKYENTYDLVKLAPAITHINLHKRSLMQVYISGTNSISNFFGGTYWESEVKESIDDHNTLVNNYHFAFIKTGNEFYIKNASVPGVNGVYAGENGHWDCWNGYACYAEQSSPSTDHPIGYRILIKRNSDNTILYRSVDDDIILPGWSVNNIHIGVGKVIEMVNVNDPTDRPTIESPFVYHIYQRLLCDVDSVSDSEGVKATYDLPLEDFVADNRNYKKCIGLTGGLFFCTSRAVDTPTRYGINDYGQYFTNQFLSATLGINRLLPISRNSWANASLWYAYYPGYDNFEKTARKKYTLKDSYSIADVIKALLSQIDPTLKHEATAEYSNFLYGELMPVYTDRFYVYIAQKTNILKGDYDQPAQKAEITLKSLMEMLRDCFRCYWYIEDNKLKIEHIRFFMNGYSYRNNNSIQLDFTKLKDQFNKKPISFFQSEVEYDKSDLSQRYEFNWMDDATDLFGGVTIDVKSSYVQKDKRNEINVSQFSSDVDYMLFNPSNFSNDGFALLCPVKNGSSYELPIVTTTLIDEDQIAYSADVQNWYAAWAYLVHFYMYDMPGYNIDCNVLKTLFVNSIKRCMKHSIEFPAKENMNELELIKTNIGNGKIDEISIDLSTCHSKVRLIYEPS